MTTDLALQCLNKVLLLLLKGLQGVLSFLVVLVDLLAKGCRKRREINPGNNVLYGGTDLVGILGRNR